MTGTRATKAQLQEEIADLRRRLADLEAADQQHRQDTVRAGQHANTLDALHATVLEVMSRLELNELLKAIVTRAGQLLDVPHGYINLYDPTTDTMELKYGVGMFASLIGYRLPLGAGLVGKIWATGRWV